MLFSAILSYLGLALILLGSIAPLFCYQTESEIKEDINSLFREHKKDKRKTK